jgi:hypothetical protein
MRFRAGDDILARIRASLMRRDHRDRGNSPRDIRTAPRTPTTHSIYFGQAGKLGEMDHIADRADDWGEADTRGERS